MILKPPHHKSSSWTRAVSLATCVIFVYVNIVQAVVEPASNFWKERKAAANKQVLLAQLPTIDSGMLPRLTHDTFSQSASLENAVGLPQSASPIAGIKLPLEFSNLKSAHIPANWTPADGLVLYIQDVHMNKEAQANIGKSIQVLIDQGKVDMVGLEGGFGDIDIHRFREFEDQDAVHKVADYMLHENKITGAIHTAFTSVKAIPDFVGVEDRKLYDGHVGAYKDSVGKTADLKKDLTAQEVVLEKNKEKVFNPALLAFDTKVQSYRKGTLQVGEYVKNFAPSPTPSISLFLKALAMEKSLDFALVEKERGVLIQKLVGDLTKNQVSGLVNMSLAYRLGRVLHTDFYVYLRTLCEKEGVNLKNYPAMQAYVSYVLLSDQIKAEKLLAEIKSVEDRTYEKLARTAQEKKLIAESRYQHLTGKLIDFSLSPEEWTEYKAGDSSSNFASFKSFFEFASLRDQALADNLMAQSQKRKSKVTVLVTGGYHSDGITRLLAKANIATVTLAPKITKIDGASGTEYLSVFTQEKTPLQKLFDGDKLFVSQEVMTPGIRRETAGFVCALTNKLKHFADLAWPSAEGYQMTAGSDGQYIMSSQEYKIPFTVSSNEDGSIAIEAKPGSINFWGLIGAALGMVAFTFSPHLKNLYSHVSANWLMYLISAVPLVGLMHSKGKDNSASHLSGILSLIPPNVEAPQALAQEIYAMFGDRWEEAFSLMGRYLTERKRLPLIRKALAMGLPFATTADWLGYSHWGWVKMESLPEEFVNALMLASTGNLLVTRITLPIFWKFYTLAVPDARVYSDVDHHKPLPVDSVFDKSVPNDWDPFLVRGVNADNFVQRAILFHRRRESRKHASLYQHVGLYGLFGFNPEILSDNPAGFFPGLTKDQAEIADASSYVNKNNHIFSIWLKDQELLSYLSEKVLRQDTREGKLMLASANYRVDPETNDADITQVQAWLLKNAYAGTPLEPLLDRMEEKILSALHAHLRSQGILHVRAQAGAQLFNGTTLPMHRNSIARVNDIYRRSGYHLVLNGGHYWWQLDMPALEEKTQQSVSIGARPEVRAGISRRGFISIAALESLGLAFWISGLERIQVKSERVTQVLGRIWNDPQDPRLRSSEATEAMTDEIIKAKPDFLQKRRITILYPASGSHVAGLDIANKLVDDGYVDEAKFIFTELKESALLDLRKSLETLVQAGIYSQLKEKSIKFSEGREVTFQFSYHGKTITLLFALKRSGERFWRPEYLKESNLIYAHDPYPLDPRGITESVLSDFYADGRDRGDLMVMSEGFLGAKGDAVNLAMGFAGMSIFDTIAWDLIGDVKKVPFGFGHRDYVDVPGERFSERGIYSFGEAALMRFDKSMLRNIKQENYSTLVDFLSMAAVADFKSTILLPQFDVTASGALMERYKKHETLLSEKFNEMLSLAHSLADSAKTPALRLKYIMAILRIHWVGYQFRSINFLDKSHFSDYLLANDPWLTERVAKNLKQLKELRSEWPAPKAWRDDVKEKWNDALKTYLQNIKRQSESYGPASVKNPDAWMHWMANGSKAKRHNRLMYRIYNIIGVNWESFYFMPAIAVYAIGSTFLPQYFALMFALGASLNVAWNFSEAHKDRPMEERLQLHKVGLVMTAALLLPIVFFNFGLHMPLAYAWLGHGFHFGLVRNPLEAVSAGFQYTFVIHSLYNFLKVIKVLPERVPMASTMDFDGEAGNGDGQLGLSWSSIQKFWGKFQQMPLEMMLNIVLNASRESGVSPSFMRQIHFYKKYDFLNGKTLKPIFQYFAERARQDPAAPTPTLKMIRDLGMEMTRDELIQTIVSGKLFHWKDIPQNAVRGLLVRVAEEKGIPASMIMTADLVNPIKTLHGRNLDSLLVHAASVAQHKPPEDGSKLKRNALSEYLQELGLIPVLDDVLFQIKDPSRSVHWERIPPAVLRQLVEKIAEDMHLSVTDLSEKDLRGNREVLGGNSLSGLMMWCDRNRPAGMTAIEFLKGRIFDAGRKDSEREIRRLRVRKEIEQFMASDDNVSKLRHAFRNSSSGRYLSVAVRPLLNRIRLIYPDINYSSLRLEAMRMMYFELRTLLRTKKYFKDHVLNKMMARWGEQVSARAYEMAFTLTADDAVVAPKSDSRTKELEIKLREVLGSLQKKKTGFTPEEQALWVEARDAGVDPSLVWETGIAAVDRLIMTQAYKLIASDSKYDVDDVIQEIRIFVGRSITRFDPSKSKWSSHVMQGLVYQASARNAFNSIIHLPEHASNFLRKFKSVRIQLAKDLGRAPLPGELAYHLKISNEKAIEYLQIENNRNLYSLDAPLPGKDTDGITLGELIPAHGNYSPDRSVFKQLENTDLALALRRIPLKYALILRLRSGMDSSQESWSLVEIGELLGVSAERVRQMEDRAKMVIRRMFGKSDGPFLYDSRDWEHVETLTDEFRKSESEEGKNFISQKLKLILETPVEKEKVRRSAAVSGIDRKSLLADMMTGNSTIQAAPLVVGIMLAPLLGGAVFYLGVGGMAILYWPMFKKWVKGRKGTSLSLWKKSLMVAAPLIFTIGLIIQSSDKIRLLDAESYASEIGMDSEMRKTLYNGRPFGSARVIVIPRGLVTSLEADPAVMAAFTAGGDRLPLSKLGGMLLSGKSPRNRAIVSALKNAGGIQNLDRFPIIIVVENQPRGQFIRSAHEMAHIFQTDNPEINLPDLGDYARDPFEQEAFLTSILAYRMKYGNSLSFYDFLRDQDGLSAEKLPDERIAGDLARGFSPLHVEKLFWDEVDAFLRAGGNLNSATMVPFRQSALNKIREASFNQIVAELRRLTVHSQVTMSQPWHALTQAGSVAFINRGTGVKIVGREEVYENGVFQGLIFHLLVMSSDSKGAQNPENLPGVKKGDSVQLPVQWGEVVNPFRMESKSENIMPSPIQSAPLVVGLILAPFLGGAVFYFSFAVTAVIFGLKLKKLSSSKPAVDKGAKTIRRMQIRSTMRAAVAAMLILASSQSKDVSAQVQALIGPSRSGLETILGPLKGNPVMEAYQLDPKEFEKVAAEEIRLQFGKGKLSVEQARHLAAQMAAGTLDYKNLQGILEQSNLGDNPFIAVRVPVKDSAKFVEGMISELQSQTGATVVFVVPNGLKNKFENQFGKQLKGFKSAGFVEAGQVADLPRALSGWGNGVYSSRSLMVPSDDLEALLSLLQADSGFLKGFAVIPLNRILQAAPPLKMQDLQNLQRVIETIARSA